MQIETNVALRKYMNFAYELIIPSTLLFTSLICLQKTFFSIVTHFIIAYHISLVKAQSNYCNNNLLTVDVEQLNKIMKFYYSHTLKALWDGQGKIKMHCGMSRVKKQLSGKGLFCAGGSVFH